MGHARSMGNEKRKKDHRKNQERERNEQKLERQKKGNQRREEEWEAIFGNFKYKDPECTRINSGSIDLILLLCVPFILLFIQI